MRGKKPVVFSSEVYQTVVKILGIPAVAVGFMTWYEVEE